VQNEIIISKVQINAQKLHALQVRTQ